MAIQAAIVKLERLKTGTTPGPWVSRSRSLYGPPRRHDPLLERGAFASSPEWFINPRDPDLIVALQRTVDAQLALLRSAMVDYQTDGPKMAEIGALARAILGDD